VSSSRGCRLFGVSASRHDFGDYGGVGVHRPLCDAGRSAPRLPQLVGAVELGADGVQNARKSPPGRDFREISVSEALMSRGRVAPGRFRALCTVPGLVHRELGVVHRELGVVHRAGRHASCRGPFAPCRVLGHSVAHLQKTPKLPAVTRGWRRKHGLDAYAAKVVPGWGVWRVLRGGGGAATRPCGFPRRGRDRGRQEIMPPNCPPLMVSTWPVM
jgi:hypothetical protein